MLTLPLNQIVGKYRIDYRVGAGGMGEVYRATNLQTGKTVAIKVLNREAEHGLGAARFRNEAAIQSSLQHPNVAELYEYFGYMGSPCIAMEFIAGRTLRDMIVDTGGLEPDMALEIMAEICDAVSYMHAKGTIHRDIKSENIRIDSQGRAKLLDFGIAVNPSTPVFTRAGCAIGTPEKMAPEQHRGLRGDAKSDVWALGVLLYEMVTGAAPFSNSSDAALHDDILAVRYVRPEKRRPGLPPAVARIIANCLREKPDERYASAGVLLREVQQARRKLTGVRLGGLVELNPLYAAAGLGVLVLGSVLYALVVGFPIPAPAGGPPETKATQSDTVDPIRKQPAPTDIPSRDIAMPDQTHRRPEPVPDPSFSAPLRNAPPPLADLTDDVKVTVVTNNGSAQCFEVNGTSRGPTPCEMRGPADSTREVLLRRPGYPDQREAITFSRTQHEFTFVLDKR